MNDNQLPDEIIRQAASEQVCLTVLGNLQDALYIASDNLESDCEISTDEAKRLIFGMFRRFMAKHMDKLESEYFLDCGAIFLGYVPIDENSAPFIADDDSDNDDLSQHGNIAA